MDSNRVIPIVIIAIALLSFIFYYAFESSDTQSTTNITTAENQPTGQSTNNMMMPNTGSAAPVKATPPADTDPVSSKDPATVVPDKMTLDTYCKAYYNAWLTEDWETAYKMIPYSQKQDMDVEAFRQRNEQYGLASAVVGEPAINNNAASIIATMQTSAFGTWLTTWSFIKNDKGQWTVQKTSSVMSQQ